MGTPREKGGTVPNFSRFPALPYRMALHSRGTQGRAGFSWGWVGVMEEEEKEGEERRGKKEGREDAGLGLGARPPACWGTSPIAPAAAGAELWRLLPPPPHPPARPPLPLPHRWPWSLPGTLSFYVL